MTRAEMIKPFYPDKVYFNSWYTTKPNVEKPGYTIAENEYATVVNDAMRSLPPGTRFEVRAKAYRSCDYLGWYYDPKFCDEVRWDMPVRVDVDVELLPGWLNVAGGYRVIARLIAT